MNESEWIEEDEEKSKRGSKEKSKSQMIKVC